MYYAVVFAFMLVLPIASMLVEPLLTQAPFEFWPLLGRWFVFWAIGVRLLTAGIRQIAQPRFTAETIFGTTDPGALKLVPELGFANVAAGVVGVSSLVWPGFVLPIALYGVVFYGLAAALHIGHAGRNRHETVALVSDAWIALLLAAFLLSHLIGA
jgi:hypothetical protein